jgi:DNA-binding CsgD family transcriptional regulator
LAVAHPDPAPCPVCTDAEWLTLAGEAPEQVAARLGLKVKSLEKHLSRHGRSDLIRRVLA